MGFGERACKWVSIMLENTSATAAFNGWQSSSFPERSRVQQGSPLSPLLYVLAAQTWPVTSDTKPSKVSSGQSPSQMVSQMVSSLPRVQGSPATSARLHLAPSSAAEGLGIPLPVASLPCADVPDAASPLAGKKRGPESMSDAESSDTAEAPTFFLFFFFCWEGEIFITRSNDNNLKEM